MLSTSQLIKVLSTLEEEYAGCFTRVEFYTKSAKAQGIVVWHVKDYGFVCGDREEGYVFAINDRNGIEKAKLEKKFCDNLPFEMVEIIEFEDDLEEN